MKKILIDSSAFIAINFKRDQFHTAAVKTNRILLEKGYEYVTTNYIMLESCTSLLMKVSHSAAVKFYEDINRSKLIEIIHINESFEEQSFQLFKRYSDKYFSLTDCSSFTIMKALKLKTAFTNDHHFEQMGFEILLK